MSQVKWIPIEQLQQDMLGEYRVIGLRYALGNTHFEWNVNYGIRPIGLIQRLQEQARAQAQSPNQAQVDLAKMNLAQNIVSPRYTAAMRFT